MKTAKVGIKFTRPYWFHAFPIDAIGGGRKEKTGSAGNDPEEWKRTYRATPDGDLYLPSEQIFASLCNGGRHTKAGRGSIMKKVAATLQVVENQILLDRQLPSWATNGNEPMVNEYVEPVYVDVRPVRNPSTRGGNIRYRLACSPGCRANFTILFDPTIVAEAQMHQVCIDAGALEGLGNGRSIGMGRFEVVSFEAA